MLAPQPDCISNFMVSVLMYRLTSKDKVVKVYRPLRHSLLETFRLRGLLRAHLVLLETKNYGDDAEEDS